MHPLWQQSRGTTTKAIAGLVVLVIIVIALTAPRVAENVVQQAVVAARETVNTQLDRARGAAVNRGCAAVVHIVDGMDARVWVTACGTDENTLDTVGTVESVSDRFGVEVTSNVDSIVYGPTGRAESTDWAHVRLSRGAQVDSLAVSPDGRAVW